MDEEKNNHEAFTQSGNILSREKLPVHAGIDHRAFWQMNIRSS